MVMVLRRLVAVLAVVLVVLAGLVALMVETAPRVVRTGPPDAAAAAAGRELAESLEAVLDPGAGITRWSATEAEVSGALAAAGRLVPGLAGRAAVEARTAAVDLSLKLPKLPADLWVNLHLAVGASEDGLRVVSARIGRLGLPAGLVVPVGRVVLDAVLGDRVATRALGEIEGVEIAPPRIEVALSADGTWRDELARRVQARLRGLGDDGLRERIYVHLWTHNDGFRRGTLPRRGSALPWLTQAVREAGARAGASDVEELQAALYALAIACGHPRFGAVVGMGIGERDSHCTRTTLDGREDLRQHFTLSAAIAAASTGRTVLGVGELKELMDSNEGGSGFSFDDMAANLAGARFAEAFLARPRGDWPAMLARIEGEGDLLPSLEGLPHGLSEAEFRARFGDVDSPEFEVLIGEIERRVEALPLYAAPRLN